MNANVTEEAKHGLRRFVAKLLPQDDAEAANQNADVGPATAAQRRAL